MEQELDYRDEPEDNLLVGIDAVFKKLSEMPSTEFQEFLKKHETGDISRIMREIHKPDMTGQAGINHELYTNFEMQRNVIESVIREVLEIKRHVKALEVFHDVKWEPWEDEKQEGKE